MADKELEKRLEKMGKIYMGKPMVTKSRRELLETLSPKMRKYLRADCGDLPAGATCLSRLLTKVWNGGFAVIMRSCWARLRATAAFFWGMPVRAP